MGIEHDYVPAVQELLNDSTFPVTIVHGGQDMCPESTSRDYSKLFPSTSTVNYRIIPDADHFLFDHPDVVAIVQDALKV